MCFSQYAQYAPRPIKEFTPPVRPADAPPTKAELDDNLFGPKPMPPEWQQSVNTPENGHGHDHSHATNGVATPAAAVHVASNQANGPTAVTSVTTQTVEAVVVELANGTKLLICPL